MKIISVQEFRARLGLTASQESGDTASLDLPLIQFFMNQEVVTDKELHAWCEANGKDVAEVEQRIYSMLKALIKGVGKHAHVPDSEFDPEQLKMGIKVEQEHTNDPGVAKIISKDHLSEIPTYYSLLKQMEKDAGVEESTARFSNVVVSAVTKIPAIKEDHQTMNFKKGHFLQQVIYVPKTKQLFVQFTKDSKVYLYEGVSKKEYTAFTNADSKGSYFANEIKNNKESRQLATAHVKGVLKHILKHIKRFGSIVQQDERTLVIDGFSSSSSDQLETLEQAINEQGYYIIDGSEHLSGNGFKWVFEDDDEKLYVMGEPNKKGLRVTISYDEV